MTKLAFYACLVVFLCLTMIGVTLVQAQATVGVSVGDEFEYNRYSIWNSDFSDTPPENVVETNQTQWLRVTVTDISGSKIYVHVTTHFKDGTEEELDGYCDIDTGEISASQIPPFISANLNEFDPINPSASDPYYVNGTIVRDYANSQRETNLLRFEQTGQTQEVGEYTRITEYYFDKATGVLVEYFFDFYYTGLSNKEYSKLLESSVWVIPEFPAWIVLPLFVALALAALAVKRKTVKPNLQHSCSN